MTSSQLRGSSLGVCLQVFGGYGLLPVASAIRLLVLAFRAANLFSINELRDLSVCWHPNPTSHLRTEHLKGDFSFGLRFVAEVVFAHAHEVEDEPQLVCKQGKNRMTITCYQIVTNIFDLLALCCAVWPSLDIWHGRMHKDLPQVTHTELT